MPLCRLEKSTCVLSTGLEKNAEHLWRLGSTEAFRFFWHPGESVDSGQLVVFSSDKLLWYNVGEYDHIIHSSKRSEVRPHVPIITSLLPSIDQLESNSQPGLES